MPARKVDRQGKADGIGLTNIIPIIGRNPAFAPVDDRPEREGGLLDRQAVATGTFDRHQEHPLMARLRAEGMTLRAIADRLNVEGHTTATGKPWSAVQVKRALDRQTGP